MSDPVFHKRIIPMPQPEVHELLATYQLTYEFRQETQYRQAFEVHCQWLAETAEQCQQEWEAMQQDINVLGWFCRK